jgi:hypothetical protein
MTKSLTIISLMLAVLIGSTGVSYAEHVTSPSIKSRLSILKELEDAGLITKEEATEKRQSILGKPTTTVGVSNPSMLWANIGTLKRTKACPKCYLQGANLQGVNLQEADLVGANLQGANLKAANLGGANLRGAKLDPEGIRKARATGAINIPAAPVIAKQQTPKSCPGTYKSTWNNCIGTRTYSDKAVYKGPWKSGKQHGQGTLTYSDGEKYVGSFKDGLHHGKGTITYPSGKVMKGIWENDKFKSERK